ncbi:META domain-containing protein [Winogradskyella schleiferi]|uniref:META domain-containing protein n=1 Tax=Winogradskyella schleiferi TaxID=2686078 RepID=UPI0015B82FFD|nr:META domain-containing protein [Winogradskyella schleiferi]
MNKFYSILTVFLCSYIGFSQNELVGEWYLDSFSIDNATYNNVYAYVNTIDFTEDIIFENYLEYSGSSSCNYFFGEYTSTNNSIIFNGFGSSLIDCYNEPRGTFENMYFSLLYNNSTGSSEFSYDITGEGEAQILTLTNSNNSSIFYSKTNPNSILHSTWYLETVIEGGITYNVTSGSPSLTLQANPHPFFGTMTFAGEGVCNDYVGEYGMYYGHGDELRITSIAPNTVTCEPPSAIETAYFSVLGDTSANVFRFEIINNGANLVLTSVSDPLDRSVNALGDILIFGTEPLSIHDFDYNEITLFKNPIQDQLELNIADELLFQNLNYSIYSLEGKLMSKSKLNTINIEVSRFATGLYFINIENKDKVVFSLKFLKE